MPVHFAGFTLDESRRQLLRGDEPVHLSPKTFQLLSILIQERPRAISKSDLQQRLWPGTFVTEGNLASLVTELRTALGDDPREQRFIRTVYGFGYSFAEETPKKQPPVWWISAAVAIAAGLALLLWLRKPTAIQTPLIRSIAILPFDTTATDRTEQHLGLGLPDLVITRLSNVRQLIVRPTSAVREFAGRGIDSRQIGRNLKVDAVLEGSIRTSPERIRVTVQLLDVRGAKPIWAGQFDEKRAEIFTIEDNISARVAEALMVRLTPNEKSLLGKRYTQSVEAYQLYLQGRYHLQQGIEGNPNERKTALDFFQKAVDKDPGYALAWAGLAHAYGGLAIFGGSAKVNWPKAEPAALKALQLDPDLSEAHSAIGAVKMYWYLDFAGAESEFRRALQLDPRNILALRYYAFLLQSTGKFDESFALHERQIEVDPTSPAVHLGLAAAHYATRAYDRAIQETLIVLGMNPRFTQAHIALSRSYALQGRYDEAIAEAQKAAGSGARNPQALAYLGYTLARTGKKDEANAILRELHSRFERDHLSPFPLAIVHIALGNREAVFPLLEKGVDDRTYIFGLKTDPLLDPIRSDPRFAALLKRAGYVPQ